MRNMISLIATLAISTLGFAQTSHEDTLKTKAPLILKAGFVYTPQAGVSLEYPKEGAESFQTFIAAIVFNKGNVTAVPFYLTSKDRNAVGTAWIYRAHPHVSPYCVVQKTTTNNNLYLSAGAMTPIEKLPFNIFMEFGNTFPEWNPHMYTGVFIGLTKEIKRFGP